MQKPTPGPVWRVLGRILVPLYYPEYRKLLIRSYVLALRLELLGIFFTAVSPFATPALLLMIRRWLDGLRRDVAEFGRLIRAPGVRVAPREQATPCMHHDGEFQNPWT